MQFKTLALAAVAVAAVSAQSFANNTCSQCVFDSFPKDPDCSTLSAADMTELTSAFNSNTVNITAISAAVAKPEIHTCVCHWASTAFNPAGTGAAGGCITGASAVCNTTQLQQATSGISGLNGILHCATSNTTSPNATTPGAGATTTAAAGASPTATNKPSAAIQLNMPYVLSVGVVGLAALFGF